MTKLTLLFSALLVVAAAGKDISVTRTNTGETFAPGDLIFDDEFNTFDFETWQHEITMGGGGNWEFQIYHNSRENSYVRDGILYILQP